ncbi:hypothetical protein ACIRS3_19720 [Streptomyces virginiae]|uniref:hypothetical protein n=1 Tax=Streptomyces virginiae TaxID=1961 RepID=UPI0037FC12FC
MTRAEPAWCRALAAQNLDGIRQQAERQAPGSAPRPAPTDYGYSHTCEIDAVAVHKAP